MASLGGGGKKEVGTGRMEIRQNMDRGALILRFSDGVHERRRRGSLAFALGLA